MELVDITDLKSVGRNARVGSTPTCATINYNKEYLCRRKSLKTIKRKSSERKISTKSNKPAKITKGDMVELVDTLDSKSSA